MADVSRDNYSAAQDAQQKFELYAISLTFTILGLSIQTSSFGRNLVSDGLELTSWFALLISGLLGLSRWESVPRIYELYGHKDRYEERAKGVRKAILQGAREFHSLEDGLPHPADEVLANAENSIKILDEHLTPANKAASRRYRMQKGFFVAGFALLISARAYLPLIRIILAIVRGLS